MNSRNLAHISNLQPVLTMYSYLCAVICPPDLADEVVANEVEMVDMRKVHDDVDVPEDTAEETESDSECKQDVAACSEVEEIEALAEPVTVQPLPSKESIGEILVTEHGEFPAKITPETVSFHGLIDR